MTKRRQVRIYLDGVEGQILDAMLKDSPMSDAQAATLIVSAGLRAIQENAFVTSIPIRFHVAKTQPATGEKAVSPKRKAA